MKIAGIIKQSVVYYRKQVGLQIVIIALLTAVITGSLLTGSSVRESLKRSASGRLGNTGILISSGSRFFDALLARRLSDSLKISCTGIAELNGYSQNLKSQKGAFNTHIFGINKDFFPFNGVDTLMLNTGEVAVNKKLADYLEIKEGDDIILKFRAVSSIPQDAPFAPSQGTDKSIVLKVGRIIPASNNGNFSLSISQIIPMNVFMNLNDIEDKDKPLKINRLLVERKLNKSISEINHDLKKVMKPSDIGLYLRKINKTNQVELISDRIFIYDAIIKAIIKAVPSAAPVLTYLGNKFSNGSKSTPYSFVSALPESLYPEIPSGRKMIINDWMANDLGAKEGDTISMTWFYSDSLNRLKEKGEKFAIDKVVDMKGIWADSLLMPEFPGISGRESCSDWDAGVPVKMNEIRTKDEDYWRKYRGTPKAFLGYDEGSQLWASNYGSATSVRFPEGMAENEIEKKIRGSLDPDITGFTFSDLYDDSIKAARESIDFGTLFLSLGFFMILASIVLLSFAVSTYFDSKRQHITTLHSIGFKNRWIRKLLLYEAAIIGLAGCIVGAFAGYLVNLLITGALNSVWQGAVQTDTLKAVFTFMPVLYGFLITFIIIMVVLMIKINRYLLTFREKKKEKHSVGKKNLTFLVTSLILTVFLFALSFIKRNNELPFSFAAGGLLLITFILAWRQYIVSDNGKLIIRFGLSRKYFYFNSLNAVAPVLFIAAGIFTVFITIANRKSFDEKLTKRSAGTGGYLFWIENSVPVKEDLNSVSGRKALGIDEDSLASLSFVQMKRSSGNDASCLNLNHIISPPLLGLDPADFMSKGAFSFSEAMKKAGISNPWQFLDIPSQNNIIYGIADQTVLDWGLKLKIGDTLKLRSEKGQPLNIVIAAGLQSSVFQGYVLTGIVNFSKYYPTISGSSVLLADGEPSKAGSYRRNLNERFSPFGTNIETTSDRLASFYQVTNTYLSIFGVFGAFGMITAIAGLGSVLIRNYNQRRREFGLLMATGFSIQALRRMILNEQVRILFTGVIAGVVSAFVASLPSIKGYSNIPWLFIAVVVLAIAFTGLAALYVAVRSITAESLTTVLKKE